jgi:hypothetical protein
VSNDIKTMLKKHHQELDPVMLKDSINRKLKIIFKTYQQRQAARDSTTVA